MKRGNLHQPHCSYIIQLRFIKVPIPNKYNISFHVWRRPYAYFIAVPNSWGIVNKVTYNWRLNTSQHFLSSDL